LAHTDPHVPPNLSTELAALAAEAESRPVHTDESRDVVQWVIDRVRSLAMQAKPAPAPALCPSCQQRLTSSPSKFLN
jgi:hypothetical protein